MELLAAFLIILLAVGWVRVSEKRTSAVTLTAEADAAMRSLRGVARRRAERHSAVIPRPHLESLQDTAPIDLRTGKPVKLEERRPLVALARRSGTEG